MNYEERVMYTLSRWMGGENLKEASKLMTMMVEEASDTSFSAGYSFAKKEKKLVEDVTESLY